MSSSIDTTKFSEMIRSKRGNKGLRQLAGEIVISASTLSRIEQGSLPDIETYLKICNWLEVSPEFFTVHSESKGERNLVIAHLRADTSLPPSTAEALIQMINIAYASVEKELI